jgi:hypothetical protein
MATTLESDVKEIESSIFERNLAFMVGRVAGEHTPKTLAMIQRDLSHIHNFHQLRSVAQAFVGNGCKPLRRVPMEGQVDPEALSGEAKLRFDGGFFLLAENEALVFRGNEAHGPYAKAEAAFMARKLGAESLTNDKLGHVLDPESAPSQPASTSVGDI